MCSVLTKVFQHQSQLWQGFSRGSQDGAEEGGGSVPPTIGPVMFPVGMGGRLSSHGQNRREEVYKNFPFLGVRQPSLYHIPKIIFHSTGGPGAGGAGPWDEDTRSGELISQSWKSKSPTATISSDVPANTPVCISLLVGRLPGVLAECSRLDRCSPPLETH